MNQFIRVLGELDLSYADLENETNHALLKSKLDEIYAAIADEILGIQHEVDELTAEIDRLKEDIEALKDLDAESNSEEIERLEKRRKQMMGKRQKKGKIAKSKPPQNVLSVGKFLSDLRGNVK